MATHSSILAWKIPWMEKPGKLKGHGVTNRWTQLSTHTHTHTHTLVVRTPSFHCRDIGSIPSQETKSLYAAMWQKK